MLFAVHMLVFYMYCLVYGIMEGAGSFFRNNAYSIWICYIYICIYIYVYMQTCVYICLNLILYCDNGNSYGLARYAK